MVAEADPKAEDPYKEYGFDPCYMNFMVFKYSQKAAKLWADLLQGLNSVKRSLK